MMFVEFSTQDNFPMGIGITIILISDYILLLVVWSYNSLGSFSKSHCREAAPVNLL